MRHPAEGSLSRRPLARHLDGRGPPRELGARAPGARPIEVTTEARPSYRQLFDIPGLPRLVGSMLLARTANTMVSLVLVLFALERYQSPAIAGLVTFMSLFPGLLLSPIAGALLDRHGRTRLMVIDYIVAGAALALIFALGTANALPAPVLLVVVTIMSLTFPLSTTGVRTLFPLLVPRPLWERANAVDSNGYVISSIFGPALAGALVATIGSIWTLALTAAMYFVCAVVTIGVRDPLGVVPHGRLLSDAWAGIVYVARNASLRGLALSVSIANVAGGLYYIGMPVLVLSRLGGGPAEIGQLFALQGLSGAISVLLVGRYGTEGRERQLLAGSILLLGVGYAFALAAPGLWFVAAVMLVLGIATGPFDVVLFTLRQRRTHPDWLGRAFAVSMSLNFIGFPIGSALGGALAPISLEATFLAALALSVVACVITFLAIPARE